MSRLGERLASRVASTWKGDGRLTGTQQTGVLTTAFETSAHIAFVQFAQNSEKAVANRRTAATETCVCIYIIYVYICVHINELLIRICEHGMHRDPNRQPRLPNGTW